MQRDLLMKTMKTSISEVLEKMFFLPLDFSDAEGSAELGKGPGDQDLIAVRLAYSGPFSGYFVLLIPRNLGRELTADFMGIDQKTVPPEHVDQTAKEILNMIAGTTFSSLDEEAVFQLGIPEALSGEGAGGKAASGQKELFLAVDTLKGPMGLLLVET